MIIIDNNHTILKLYFKTKEKILIKLLYLKNNKIIKLKLFKFSKSFLNESDYFVFFPILLYYIQSKIKLNILQFSCESFDNILHFFLNICYFYNY